jgi:DNA replication protein
MKEFQGFPARMEFTSVPNVFFSSLLPQITDLAELKATLHVIAALYRKKGHPRYVSCSELLADAALMDGLKAVGGSPEEALRRGLKLAAERGTLITLALDKDGGSEDVYLLNTASDRQTVAKIESGELTLKGLKFKEKAYVELEEQPNIFKLYEDNIGMLTPTSSAQLLDAEKNYPQDWIRDAIKEAVAQNIRKWSYISAILARWATEGRSDGAYQRDSKKADPDKYVKGKYGHMVRR